MINIKFGRFKKKNLTMLYRFLQINTEYLEKIKHLRIKKVIKKFFNNSK